MENKIGDPRYGAFSLRLITGQGYPLAVGGLCPPGSEPAWTALFRQMTHLELNDLGPYSIDYALASKLVELGDGRLPALGATVRVTDAAFSPGQRSGGVLGCPQAGIQSSPGKEEPLPDGFSLYTLPGGPGLLALADEAVVKEAFAKVTSVPKPDTERFLSCFRRLRIPAGILVFDGTGDHSFGYLLTFAGDTWSAVWL